MAKLIVISWRDIPAQVVVKKGRETGKVQLSHRFQEAVDRAAMRAGKASSTDYLADWKRSEPRACGDDIQAEANAEAQAIEARYSDDDLLRLIRAHGIDETLAPSAPPAGEPDAPPAADGNAVPTAAANAGEA
jgi:hypothetical protein